MRALFLCALLSLGLLSTHDAKRHRRADRRRLQARPRLAAAAGRAAGKGRRPAHAGEQDVYPDTTRNYWVYVPAQYDAAKPACLMVFQDGHAFVNPKGDYRIPFVFDNLIYRREMPVTIGVFINPGRTPEQKEATAKRVGRPDQQPPRRVQRAGRQVLEADHRRAAAGAEEGLQHLRQTPTTAPSPAPAPARSARSPSPGTGPTSSAR